MKMKRHHKQTRFYYVVWEKTVEYIQDKYWGNWPYDWRPGQLWYGFKCWSWHRYTTIKPKTLPYHTWCDRRELLPHFMFEILTQFVEKECSPGHVDWKASNHTVVVNEQEVNVRDEMQYLYVWWNTVYIKRGEKTHDEWYEFVNEHSKFIETPIVHDDEEYYEWGEKWDSKENEKIGDKLHDQAQDKLDKLERELQENMHRLVNLRTYLWT